MRIFLALVVVVVGLGCDRSSPPALGPSAPAPVVPAAPVAPAAPVVPAAPAVNGIDPCILGVWRLTPEHATDFYRAALAGAGGAIDSVAVEGTAVVSLSASGDTTFDMSAVRVRVSSSDARVPMEMNMAFSGAGHADFTAHDGTIEYTNSTNEIRGTVTVRVAGQERSMPWNAAIGESMGRSISGSHTYRCSAGELVITSPGSPAPVTWVR